jgi:hypothetical protein
MRAEWHGSVGRVAVHADRLLDLLGHLAITGSRIDSRHAGQRVRVSGGLEQIGGEHGVGHWPGQRHALALVLHAPVLEPDFDGRLLEAELGSQFTTSRARNVILLEEFLLQTGQLFAAEGRPVTADGWPLTLLVVHGLR